MPKLTRNDLKRVATKAMLLASKGFQSVKDDGAIPGLNVTSMIGPVAQAFVMAALKEQSGEEILKLLFEEN